MLTLSRLRRRTRTRLDSGFTLMEMIVAIAVLAIIIVPLSMAVITMFRQTGSIEDRLSRSADAQRIGAAWTKDVHSLEPGGINASGTCVDPGGAAPQETQLVTFTWGTSTTSGSIRRTATWVVEGSGINMQLVRRYCENDVPISSQVLADRIGIDGASVTDVVHGPDTGAPREFCPPVNRGSSAVPRMISESCTIVVDGAFSYELTVSRRVPERDPAGAPDTVPPPPTITQVAGRYTYVSAVWTAPPAWEPPIDGYRLFAYTSPGGSQVASAAVDQLSDSADLTGLTLGTEYWVRAQSHNAVGWGDLGPAVGPVIPQATAPDAVTDVVAVAGAVGAPRTANISWNMPAIDGGSPIDSIRVTPIDAQGNPMSPLVVPGQPTSATYTNLKPDTTYTFKVEAHNGTGWGLPAESNSIETLPPQPTNVQVTPGDGRILVRFDVAENGDVPLAATQAVRITATCVTPSGTCTSRQYVIDHPSPTAPNGTWGPFNSASVTPTPAFTNGEDYNVTVELKNASGQWGPASAAQPVRPVKVPDPPNATNINSTGANNTLAFTIGQPSNGGSPITSYRVVHQASGEWVNVAYQGLGTLFDWNASTPTFTGTLAAPVSAGTLTMADFALQGFKIEACNAVGCSNATATFSAMPGPAPVASAFTTAWGPGPRQVLGSVTGTPSTTAALITQWVMTCSGISGSGTGQGPLPITVTVPAAGNTDCAATPTNRLPSTFLGAAANAFVGGNTLTVDDFEVYGTPTLSGVAIDLPATGIVNNVTVRALNPQSGGSGSSLTYTATCTSSPGSGSGNGGSTNSVPVSGLTQGTDATCTITVTNAAGYQAQGSTTRKLIRTTPAITLLNGTRTIAVQQSGSNGSIAGRMRGLARVQVDPGINVTGLRWNLNGTTTSGVYGTSSWSIWKTDLHASNTYQEVYVWFDIQPPNGNWWGFGNPRAQSRSFAVNAQVTGTANYTGDASLGYWGVAEWQANGEQDFPAVYETASPTENVTRTPGQQFTASFRCDDNDGDWFSDDDVCDDVNIRIRRLTDNAVVNFGNYDANDGTLRNHNITIPGGTGSGFWVIEGEFCNENGSCPAGGPGGYDDWQMLGRFVIP